MILTDIIYLVSGIGVIVLLIVLFFVLYFMNKNTPIPKECEGMAITQENCGACANVSCRIKKNLEEENKENQ